MAGQWDPIEDVRSRPVLNLIWDAGTLSWIRQTAAGAGGGGTEYTEGDVDATITGPVVMWEDAGNAIVATSAVKPLPVNVVAGGTSGVQYTEGDVDASITGTAVMWEEAVNTLRPASVATPLPIQTASGNDFKVQGGQAHDAAGAGQNPVTIGGYASAAAPADVSADVDVVRAWYLRNGAQAVVLTAAGALIPGSATDGLLVNLGANNDVAVTGSVTANAGTNLNTSALALEAGGNLATLAGAVKNEDVASANADPGLVIHAKRLDTPANSSGTDGDYEPLQMSAGRLWVSAVVTSAPSTVVTATNLDIRDLVAASDAVTIHGDVGVADQLDLTNSNPLAVAIVDSNGDQITSFGGGTQYAQGTATTDTDVLTMAGAVRRDTAAVATGVLDGDRLVLSTDSAGRLRVTSIDVTQPISAASLPLPTGASTSAAQTTGNTSLATIAGAVSGTEMQVDVVAALPAGTNNIGDVDVLSVVPGTAATSLGKAEDAAHSSGDVGVMALSVRQDTAAALAGTDADYQPLITDASGRLHVNVGNTVTVASHAVTNAGTFAVQVDGAALTALQLIDDTVFADDAAFTLGTSKVNAIGLQAVAHGAAPDAAEAGDAVIPIANRHRVQWVIGGHPNIQTSVYNTDGVTDDNILPAIAGGTKYVITRITLALDEACTVGVTVRIGFGTAAVPALGAADADGVAGILVYHPGMIPGQVFSVGDGSGAIGVGGDGEEPRITADTTTGGTLGVSVSWYTIES